MRLIDGTAPVGASRFALVVSRFNDFVTDRLQAGAIEALTAAGVPADSICVVRVPGAFEIPIAARRAAQTGDFAAIVCLGCIVRGETPHFDFLASAVAHGITAAAADTGIPMTFGVLTTNSIEEAVARAGAGVSNKGWEAAVAAMETVAALGQIGRPLTVP